MSRLHPFLAAADAIKDVAVKEAPIHYIDPGIVPDLIHHFDPGRRSDPYGLLNGDFFRGREDRLDLLGAVRAAFQWNSKPPPPVRRKIKPPPPIRRKA